MGRGEEKQAICKAPSDHKVYSRFFTKGKCALCKNDMLNPCILETSGFAFCYGCLQSHLHEQNTCPVTLVPSTISQIRKVYLESD